VQTPIRLGIDASNIRAGGGLSHLSALLKHGNPPAFGFEKVVIWGGQKTLSVIEPQPWLEKIHVPALDRNLVRRYLWRICSLNRELRNTQCNALFSPGGILPPLCRLPAIIMSQNLLPFERKEYLRAPRFSSHRLKMELVRQAQMKGHRQAKGIIFLSQYAQQRVFQEMRKKSPLFTIIPHGLEERFFLPPRRARPLSDFSLEKPLKLLYVSTVFYYKHPWHVAQAVSDLRAQGYPVSCDFIGDGLKDAKARLTQTIGKLDPQGRFLFYRGGLPFDQVHQAFQNADLFVFASSCETIASTVLEAMASGLPIASSDRGPLSEVLGSAAVYFDPEQPAQISGALKKLLDNVPLRQTLAKQAFEQAHAYSWTKCAEETFSFLAKVINSTF
jgi:glycosyltransferase involved in cell wall biosynthesis